MAILIDTNILLRLLQPDHPHCALVERALATLRTRNETLNITLQNLMEFWAVATRPTSENGLGMTVENATAELAAFQRLFTLLPETAMVFQEWERLVTTHLALSTDRNPRPQLATRAGFPYPEGHGNTFHPRSGKEAQRQKLAPR
jgi:predicted nucleic acid-binding protein